MADGKVNKYAIIINRSSDAKGAEETRRIIQDAKRKGYVTYLASDKNLGAGADMYVSNPTALKYMIAGLKGVIDDDDRVAISVISNTNKPGNVAGKSNFASKDVMEQLDVLRRRNGLFTEENYDECYRTYTYWDSVGKVTEADKRAGAYWCIKAAKRFSFVRNRNFQVCTSVLRDGYSSPEATRRCVDLVNSGRFVFVDDFRAKVGSK